jgi:hypothetical protein
MLERRGDRVYAYGYHRAGGKVRRVYLGRDEAALGVARVTQELARLRLLQRQQALQAQQRREQAMAPLEQLSNLLALVTRATLERLGYHQHARGQWRKRRDSTNAEERVPRGTEADPGAGRQR